MSTDGRSGAYNARDVSTIDRYLAHLELERRVSPHTRDAYALDLGKLAAFAAGEGTAADRLDLDALEAQQRASDAQVDLFAPPPPAASAAPPSPLEDAVADLDPDSLTPREALDALYRLRKLLPKEGTT